MGRWKLWFVLLLLPTSSITSKGHSRQRLVKTPGSEPAVTPVCRDQTLSVIIFIICKIRTEGNEGEECRLMYQNDNFVHECDSRFTLKTQNQTVFLHLTSLTPVDSGNYTCECVHRNGTDVLHLNVTVEAPVDQNPINSTEIPSVTAVSVGVIIVSLFIGVSAVILGIIHRKVHSRGRSHPLTSHLNTVLYLQKPQVIEPYSTFMQRENGRYSTTQIYSYANYPT